MLPRPNHQPACRDANYQTGKDSCFNGMATWNRPANMKSRLDNLVKVILTGSRHMRKSGRHTAQCCRLPCREQPVTDVMGTLHHELYTLNFLQDYPNPTPATGLMKPYWQPDSAFLPPCSQLLTAEKMTLATSMQPVKIRHAIWSLMPGCQYKSRSPD